MFVCVRERENVCVCWHLGIVKFIEEEKVFVQEREREKDSVCVCECERERERERESVLAPGECEVH